jgi:septal ring factor EnvC (AmiA/AmiB activator)
MTRLETLKFQLKEKETELSKSLQTFVLNPNISELVTEISSIKAEIVSLEDTNNGKESD